MKIYLGRNSDYIFGKNREYCVQYPNFSASRYSGSDLSTCRHCEENRRFDPETHSRGPSRARFILHRPAGASLGQAPAIRKTFDWIAAALTAPRNDVKYLAPLKHDTVSFGAMKNAKYLAPLKHDTVSFGAMKKSEFEGFDLLLVNMPNLNPKPPIEKFKSKEDLHTWAKGELDKKLELEQYTAKPEKTKYRGIVVPAEAQEGLDEINNNRMPISKTP